MTINTASPTPKKKTPIWAIVLILCVACSCIAFAVDRVSFGLESAGLMSTRTPRPTATFTAPPAPTSTLTPDYTATPEPTATATFTPLPTATSTPLPEPVILTGSGDSVVDLQKWNGPAILKVTYTGQRNFIVKNYASGDNPDLLVNTIGAYTGTLPLDFLDSEQTTRFEISASGKWELQVIPFQQARRETVPGKIQGVGDDVIILIDAVPDLLKIDATQASHNFMIWAYGKNRDLLVNEIAPYVGTVTAQKAYILVINATGPWTIETTAK